MNTAVAAEVDPADQSSVTSTRTDSLREEYDVPATNENVSEDKTSKEIKDMADSGPATGQNGSATSGTTAPYEADAIEDAMTSYPSASLQVETADTEQTPSKSLPSSSADAGNNRRKRDFSTHVYVQSHSTSAGQDEDLSHRWKCIRSDGALDVEGGEWI
jgi:hypothetical protein